MRPVDKGGAPRDFSDYQQAGPDLRQRLGDYCSYCERRLETSLAVEHIQPKQAHPDLECDWGNFLLGCVNCNSCKGKSAIVVTDYLWPDRDNTLLSFDYGEAGRVSPSASVSEILRMKAAETIALLGLDKEPGQVKAKRPTPQDARWRSRAEVYEMACRYAPLASDPGSIPWRAIVDLARQSGGFSIWYSLLAEFPTLRRELREAFPGTASMCFDCDENPVARPGGQL